MRKVLLIFMFLNVFPFTNYAQAIVEGEVIEKQFMAPSIVGNKGGEDPNRRLSIYLPQGYESGNQNYPTVYFLHGFAIDDRQIFQYIELKTLLDKAIESKLIRPFIMVLPNSSTTYGGSFYTNSKLTGNWSDYIGNDVVDYIDSNFRTIANRDSRAICGHSMGGNGALKIAMLFPDVFSVVYAMSPGVLDWSGDFSLENTGFDKIYKTKNAADIMEGLANWDPSGEADVFYAPLMVDLGRTYSPSFDNSSIFEADFPVYFKENERLINVEVQKKWEDNFPMNMIDTHLEALQKLKALKIDWGRNENFEHIPITALRFSKKLESFGIEHFAEEYIGDHINKLEGFEGRFYTELFPFVDRYFAQPVVVSKKN